MSPLLLIEFKIKQSIEETRPWAIVIILRLHNIKFSSS